MLINKSLKIFEYWDFLEKIKSQPIPMEELVSITFGDFDDISTSALLFNISFNLKEKGKEQNKNLEMGLKNV